MANEQNLIPFTSDQDREEAKKNGKKGGVASGEVRRAKKSMQELAKIILNLSIENGEIHSVENIQSIAETKGKNLTVDQAILLKQVEKALKGDLQSATFIRDTSGNKPVEKVETAEVPKIIDDIQGE